jgi:hypothetical protein
MTFSHQLIAKLSLAGMGFDALGGCYLAYDLLGGKLGPLRTLMRAIGYMALFLIGYAMVLGLSYGMVAAAGMGFLLAIELRPAGPGADPTLESRNRVLLFGFLRGVVLGLAGMTIAGPKFGALFGLFSGIGLMSVYLFGFSPIRDQEKSGRPHLSRRKLQASGLRALAVSTAGVLASFLTASTGDWVLFGLRLGLAAGTVSALVSLFNPTIEWWVENLPERRLGVLGLGLVFLGMLLQSVPNWVTVFNLPVT